MSVEGTATAESVVEAVEAAGYGASEKKRNSASGVPGGRTDLERETKCEAKRLRVCLAVSIILLAILMYATMGHMMLGWPLPQWFVEPEPNHVAMGLTQLLLSGAIIILNGRFFTSGFRSLVRGGPNMDSLVALGSGAAFAWSVAVLFCMTRAQLTGGTVAAEEWMGQLNFESSATILTLVGVGKFLEARAKGKTTGALAALLRLAPETAVVVRNGLETEIPVSGVREGDIFIVRPGSRIPVDGVVETGESAVDESALTGESVPSDKRPGSLVSAATTNVSGFLRCKATGVGENTALSKIIQLVQDAASTKAPVARLADRVAAVFVPAVVFIAALTLGVWLSVGADEGTALARAISVLVVSCPCALGLATPVAIMVGSGVGARHGVLFKTAAALEAAGRADIVVLDKTGTVTTGEPQVVGVSAGTGDGDGTGSSREAEENLLAFAAALESGSEHPLAKAIVRSADERGIVKSFSVERFRALPGSGVEACIDGAQAFGGSVKAADGRGIELAPALRAEAEKSASNGATPIVFAKDGNALGFVAVADAPKSDAASAIADLRKSGCRVLLLTGDNERTAKAVASAVGIDEVVAGVLPDGKHDVVERLKKQGRVAMVGDGVNDAPALAAVDVGLAIGAGTDVAIDAADIVLARSNLSDVHLALKLGRATLRNVRENLFWAFLYNVLLIPLAAGVWYPLFGWKMHPDLGALAMSLSSVCVCLNALRLNFFRR